MQDLRWKEAGALLAKFKRINPRRKWLIYRKGKDTALDGVYDTDLKAKQAWDALGDEEKLNWEIEGPVVIATSRDLPWIDSGGDPHIEAIRFKTLTDPADPQKNELWIYVDLQSGETIRVNNGDKLLNWHLSIGSVR